MMKAQKLSVLLLSCLLFAFSSVSKDNDFQLEKKAVALSPNVWISKYEVSQKEYKRFLLGLIENGQANRVPEFAPDSNAWFIFGRQDVYTHLYFKHPVFENYPMVAITHQAATAYCEWMTETYGQMVTTQHDANEEASRYRFRLPTEAEWLEAAGEGKQGAGLFPGGYTYPRDHKGRFVFNHKLGKGNFAGFAGGLDEDYEGYTFTAPVTAFYPDATGLYNMTGNVAEMLAEPGLAKGGSWNHEANDCRLQSVQKYEKPEAWLGFRVVVERMPAEKKVN